MALNLQTIESHLHDAVHSVLAGLEGAEPGIEAGAGAALLAAGAPAPDAAAAESLLTELLNHFRSEAIAQTPAPEPVPAPQPQLVRPVAASQLSN